MQPLSCTSSALRRYRTAAASRQETWPGTAGTFESPQQHSADQRRGRAASALACVLTAYHVRGAPAPDQLPQVLRVWSCFSPLLPPPSCPSRGLSAVRWVHRCVLTSARDTGRSDGTPPPWSERHVPSPDRLVLPGRQQGISFCSPRFDDVGAQVGLRSTASAWTATLPSRRGI